MSKQVKSPMKKYSLEDLNNQFPTEDAALDWLRHKLYPSKIFCQNCQKSTKHHRISGRKVYGCDYCGHQISPTAGTIFHKSDTPLTKWFYAIYLLASTRTGISAKQLERELDVTYKTAWRMFTLIHSRLDEGGDAFGSNGGNVEVDETYVGGVRKGKRGRGAAGKTPIVGAVERGGSVKALVVPNTQSKTVMPFIEDTVSPDAIVNTDEYNVYDRLAQRGFTHQRVAHGKGEFVNGNAHTNSIDGFWAQAKNAVSGVHHEVAPEYLQQ